MRRALFVVCLLVLGAAGSVPALAQDAGTTTSAEETTTDAATTTETVTTTDAATTTETVATVETEPPPEPPPPPVVAEGVTIAGIPVGGLTGEEAAAAVQATFARPLLFKFRSRRWATPPLKLGAHADVAGAVAAALVAPPHQALTLDVRIAASKLTRYVARLDRRLSRAARSSRVSLRGLRPFVSKPRTGFDILRRPTRTLIRRALATHARGPLRVDYRRVRPAVRRSNFGPVIVIRRNSKRLYLYNGMRYRATFGVATGMSAYPTPLGRFSILTKARNPWWFPPDRPWAQGASPVPPGPSNPLGTRWMGLGGGIGIHGTPQAWSIGSAASHGCIRMLIPEAEWLFERVRIGTPVFIVGA